MKNQTITLLLRNAFPQHLINAVLVYSPTLNVSFNLLSMNAVSDPSRCLVNKVSSLFGRKHPKLQSKVLEHGNSYWSIEFLRFWQYYRTSTIPVNWEWEQRHSIEWIRIEIALILSSPYSIGALHHRSFLDTRINPKKFCGIENYYFIIYFQRG